MLHRIEGLEVHPGSEPDSLTVSVNNGRRANFEVLSMSVLSQENADELVRLWLPSEELRVLASTPCSEENVKSRVDGIDTES
jgi:hypothetical protein